MRGSRSLRGEHGVALLLTAILGVALLGGWALAWRATHDTIRAERFLVQRAERADGVQRALADAVLRLETGEPSSSPYECVQVVAGDPDDVSCHITFTQESLTAWSVEVREATEAEVLSLPSLPLTF